MILTIVPYCPAQEGRNLGFAYNAAMERLREDDWACFLDHDACFTTREWYQQLEDITARLAEPCLLTSATNRVGCDWQVVTDVDCDNHSMSYHRVLGAREQARFGTQIDDVTDRSLMSGVVILLSKRTWRLLGGFRDGFLGVDNHLHQTARDKGLRVYLMRGVYVYHWYRAEVGPGARRERKPSKPGAAASPLAPPEPSPSRSVSGSHPPAHHRSMPVTLEDVLGNVPDHAKEVLHVAVRPLAPPRPDPEGLRAPEPARQLSARRTDVVVGDGEFAALTELSTSFDCILCPNVLQYVRDPEALLIQLRRRLKEDGRLIAAIPNSRHQSIIAALLAGEWSAPPAGNWPWIRPLRFFTRREAEKFFYLAGFDLHSANALECEGLARWRQSGSPTHVQSGSLLLECRDQSEAEEFHAGHYLFSVGPRQRPEHGLTSIVIVTHNQLSYTRRCIDSIRYRTREPYELIVVDNGSTDGTMEYLESLGEITLVANAENRGFPAAANQGIRASRGHQVLLLNNDTLVTTGWLDRMLRALHRDPLVGLVGPCSNNVSGNQQVRINYTALTSLDGFAWEWGKAHDGEFAATDRLVGFCLLIRRAVIDRIGELDERFGIGNFEDDDFTLRAAEAGFRAVIARDAFVHHFGSQTFRASGVDLNRVLQENAELFRQKWAQEEGARGELADAGLITQEAVGAATPLTPLPPFKLVVGPHGGLLLEQQQIRVSLCMIVRDSSATLAACLESIRSWVDEMVVVDTGSRDDTPDLARRLGARVFHFPWCDDFATARNESIRHARGQWIFWMDSDDTIDAENARKLRALAEGADSAVMGFVVQVHCPGIDGHTDVTAVDHIKLFRNLPELRFEFRIHEQLLPSIRRMGGEVAWTNLFVVHSGSDQTPQARRRKCERDLRLLEMELRDKPGHSFTLFNFGMTYADMGEHAQAVQALRRSLTASDSSESHVRKIYALLVASLWQLEQYDQAWTLCQEGLTRFPTDAELQFRRGMLSHQFGRLEEAEAAYLAVLGCTEARHFSSLDRGISGFKTRHNLAVVYTDLGRHLEAERQWRMAIEEAPGFRAAYRGLVESLVRQGLTEEAEIEAEKAAVERALGAEGLILKADVAKAQGDRNRTRGLLETAVMAVPEDVEGHRALSQFLFEHGHPAEAEQALLRLLGRQPEDAAAHHNLGTLYLRSGHYLEAAEAYRRSLRIRPKSPMTQELLDCAVQKIDGGLQPTATPAST